jgi:hypothetical protein
MNRAKLVHPARPWYREPWPWILMAGPFAAVVGGMITAWIAVTHSDPLVVDNYYKEGLAINRAIARDEAAARAGYRAQIMVSEDRSRVRVYLTGASPLPEAIRLRFVHPTRADRDRTLELKGRQTGWYEGQLGLQEAPRWQIQLEDADRSWRLAGEWRPTDGDVASLQSRDARK